MSPEFLRGVLGIVGLGCAYMTGRSVVAVRKGWQKPSTLYGWMIRSTVCLLAIMFRSPVDTVALSIWALAAVAFAVAMWETARRKPPEDLTRQIFPDEH